MKRFLSMFLVLVTLFNMVAFAAPQMVGTVGYDAEEENGENNDTDMQLASSPTTITVSEVESRIQQLKTLLNGKYFTVNQSACIPDSEDLSAGYHGECVLYNPGNCNNKNIVATSWFKDMFGEANVSNFPGVGTTSAASTCAGFANFAMWYLFKSSNTDTVTVFKVYENVPMTTEYLSKLKPGDGIRTSNPHSLIYISNNEYFDCNGWNAGTSKASIVEFYNGTNIIANRYSGKTMTVYRATNYNTDQETIVSFSEDSTKYSIGETNAVISTKITVTGDSYKNSTKIGVYLYDNAGNQLATKSETPYTGYDGYLLSWYNINDELGITLKPGTTYKFKFFVVISGNTYYENIRSFTTTGNASYTITFNPNGGSVSTSNKTVTNKSTYGSLPTPTRTGYTFNGWYTSASGGTKITSSSTVNLSANQTLYAQWNPINYTVTYNANGGSGAPANQTKTHGVNLTLSTTKPTRAGYTFQGWATSASGSVVYASGASYTNNASVTLYAVWKANTYTVTYNANGGSGAPANQTKTHGVNLTLSTTKPTRAGYTFQGWATSASGSVVYASGASYTNNASVTLYAVWQANTYTLTFNANGGTVSPTTAIVTYGGTCSLPTPERTGYTFEGWYASNGTQITSSTKFTGTTNTTLTARWTAHTYTVAYNANGGENAPASQTKTHDVNLTLSTTAPTRDDYIFKGWSTSANGSVAYAAGATYTSNSAVTLYAIWELNNISVTGITLNKTSTTMNVGATETLTATVSPSNATNKAVTWTSSNTNVASVSNGVVTAKAAGTATITVKTADGNKTATCTVTVKTPTVAVTGVSLNKTATTLTVGGTETLTATVSPNNATNKTVTWTSSNPSVVSVSNGVITAKAAGTATITVKTTDGNKTASCVVVVSAPEEPVDPDAPVIFVSSERAKAGETVVVSVEIDNNPGISGLQFSVAYDDSVLTLVNASDEDSDVRLSATLNPDYSNNPYVVNFFRASNDNSNGILFTMEFEISPEAEDGAYSIAVNIEKSYDQNFNNVDFVAASGDVIVANVVLGDANGDNEVDIRDVVLLAQYCAGWDSALNTTVPSASDTNGDGEIDIRDVVLLAQFCAGWDVTLG